MGKYYAMLFQCPMKGFDKLKLYFLETRINMLYCVQNPDTIRLLQFT